MLLELAWFCYASLRQVYTWQEHEHTPMGWAGLFLFMGMPVILFILGRNAMRRKSRQMPRRRKWLLVGALPIMALAGMVCVVFGTHLRRRPMEIGIRVPGVQIVEGKGPLKASYGLLVLIGGYGAESPMLSEPPRFREADASSAATLRDPFLSQFRHRLIIHPQGGLGWPDWEPASRIGSALNGYIERRRRELGVDAFPAVVVAHSRGTQIAEATPLFRQPDWLRIAVSPPAGVHAVSRLFAPFSPEITEIHNLGQEKLKARLANPVAPEHFPWNAVYQARGWDYVVERFPLQAGLPLRNSLPMGGHVLPYRYGGSSLWRDIQRELENDAPYGATPKK
ncbi:MAG: hypothetical protein WC789_08070 [Lentisphaeria bacterium]|jgi:hypothetical protein